MRIFKVFSAIIFVGLAVTAQPIPGRYIVEFDQEPVFTAAAPRLGRFAGSNDLQAARSAVLQSQAGARRSIELLGGRVNAQFDLVLNGMSVELDDAGIDAVRRMPGVRGVYRELKHHSSLDRLINVHKIREAWQSVTGGQMGAGAGIKIGIVDSGIDSTHPAFQGFTTEIPSGFPKLSADSLRQFANNKVIVVRDYTGEGGQDIEGHGTGVAMAAGGGLFDPKVLGIPAFTGVAPAAWLGNYHVFDSKGESTTTRTLQAFQDAVADGMNVINYSGGAPALNVSDENGAEARAVRNALAAGVLVVVSAGNDGPEPGTMHVPGAATEAIGVGANLNERIFDVGVTVNDQPGVAGEPGGNTDRADQIQAIMIDAAQFDPTGQGCSAYPSASFKGKIALISRGECTFDEKAANAEAAGAIGIVVFNHEPEGGLIHMAIPTSTVPSMFVTNASGLALKAAVAGVTEPVATVDYSGLTAVPSNSDSIAYFSAGGPTLAGQLKPDILATGSWVATANTQQGTQFNIMVVDGTSFSAPVVAGALAVLMSARPGLSAPQYRSLLINSVPRLNWTSGEPVSPQVGGTGKLNLVRSLTNTTVAEPTLLSFQSVTGGFDMSKTVRITNLGDATDTFTVAVSPVNKTGAVAVIDSETFTLPKGETKLVTVRLSDPTPTPGEVHGFLEVTGTKSPFATRIPYWLGVKGSSPKYVALLEPTDLTYHRTGDIVEFDMRVLDAAGLPIEIADLPEITTTAPRASLVEVRPAGSVPGTFHASLRVGRADANGLNVFTLTAGTAKRQIIFIIY